MVPILGRSYKWSRINLREDQMTAKCQGSVECLGTLMVLMKTIANKQWKFNGNPY
jgi:hypothetical protein